MPVTINELEVVVEPPTAPGSTPDPDAPSPATWFELANALDTLGARRDRTWAH